MDLFDPFVGLNAILCYREVISVYADLASLLSYAQHLNFYLFIICDLMCDNKSIFT
jgi:hypothetical protein